MGFKFLHFICSFLLFVCSVNLPVELALVKTGAEEVTGGTAGFNGQQWHRFLSVFHLFPALPWASPGLQSPAVWGSRFGRK